MKRLSTILVLSMILLIGCDKKMSHYNNGETLICIENNFFSPDRALFINEKNSKTTSRNYRDGFRKNGDFVYLNDCYIKEYNDDQKEVIHDYTKTYSDDEKGMTELESAAQSDYEDMLRE